MINIVFDIAFIIIFATILAYIARLLKQPMIVAYIIAGLIIGPMGLGLITDTNNIHFLAELGVAFLLFVVGLEIDLNKLKDIGKATLFGGTAQVIITFLLGYLIAFLLGFETLISIYVGMLIAFSSTMIVTKMLIDENKLKTINGRIMIGILLLQDVVVMIALPLLFNIETSFSSLFVLQIILKGFGLLAIAMFLNRYLLPKILDYAAEMRELLFLTALSICFMFIGFSYILGFSIIIGAFIAGLALGKFPYDLEILGETRSLMEFFSILFFTTLGIQMNFGIISTMFYQFAIIVLAIILLKPVIIYFIYMALGYGSRISSNIGFNLSQASEFTFVIALQGLFIGHLNGDIYSLIISIVVATIILTPYISKIEGKTHNFIFSRIGKEFNRPRMLKKMEKQPKNMKNHIILFGCHSMGERIAQYLKNKKRKFIIVDNNPEIVNSMRRKGYYIIYGDMENPEVLKAAGLTRAKMVIITTPDVKISAAIIRMLKRKKKRAKAVARAYTRKEEEFLYKNGSNFVIIPDELSAERIIGKIRKYI